MREVQAFPGPLQAALLTLLASFMASLIFVATQDLLTPTAALGVASVAGIGAAGALGATSIPPPHAERVGLVGLAWRQLPPLLLLLPVALLASEADNLVKALVPPPDAPAVVQQALEKLPTDTSLALLETGIVAVGLVPVVEEWFFRGVLQQGLVARMGPIGGIVTTALLFALGHGGPGLSGPSWAAVVAQSLVLGLAFGFARHVSGSLLAAILLHVGVNGLGLAGLALPQLAIPGYNAPGAHTPLPVLAAAAVAIGVGAWWLLRASPPRGPIAAAPPDPRPEDEDGPDLPS